MLGLNAFSSSPLSTSQSNGLIALVGVAATGAVEGLSVGGFEVDISERLGSVSATGAIGTISFNTEEKLGSVSATGSVNTVTVNHWA